jgi:hypothetical protein
MRVVIVHRAPGLAVLTAVLAGAGALAAGVQFLITQEWTYLLAMGVALVFCALGLRLSQGVRTTLDADVDLALWERTGLMPARRQARLSDVRDLQLLPASRDPAPAYTPVLTVGRKRWPLTTRAVFDAAAAQLAIAELLNVVQGRRSA